MHARRLEELRISYEMFCRTLQNSPITPLRGPTDRRDDGNVPCRFFANDAIDVQWWCNLPSQASDSGIGMGKKNDIGGWYLADIVERSEAVGADKSNPNRRCLTWVNTLLIRAPSLSAAYDKTLKTRQ